MAKNKIVVHKSPFNLVEYCLVKTSKQLKSVCKTYGISPNLFDELPDGTARCEVCVHTGVSPLCIVRIHKSVKKFPLPNQLGLLVHECNHIKRSLLEEMGEAASSAEFDCYVLQDIAANLLADYLG